MWPRRKRKEQKSKHALADARRHLEQTQDRASEVTAVSDALRTVREKDYLVERLADIMAGNR